MKIKELFFKVFKKTKSKVIFGVIIALLIIFVFSLPFIYNRKSTIDTNQMNLLLSKSSELTTAKLKITAMSEFKDSGIAILNRSDFVMVYTATVRAGINMEDVRIEPNEVVKKINIYIPKAQIQEAKVDTNPENIKFFDTKFALFNVNEKEDLAKAISLAEEEAKKEAEKTGILELANQQSATLIKGILAETIPEGYEIEIKE